MKLIARDAALELSKARGKLDRGSAPCKDSVNTREEWRRLQRVHGLACDSSPIERSTEDTRGLIQRTPIGLDRRIRRRKGFSINFFSRIAVNLD